MLLLNILNREFVLQGSKGGGLEVLSQLFLANEDFRGRVQRQHIAAEIQAVCPS